MGFLSKIKLRSKSFFEDNKYILIIFLVFVILFYFLLKDTDFLSVGGLSFVFSPSDGIKNLSFMWNERSNFGVSNFLAWQIFPIGIIYYLFNFLHFSTIFTQIIIFSLLFTCGFFSFGLLFGKIFGTKNFISQFLSSLLYVFNLYVITIILDGSPYHFIPYALLPLQIYIFLKGIEEKRWIRYSVILSLINLLSFGVNMVYNFILIFFLISYVAYFYILDKQKIRKSILFLSTTGGVTLLLVLWWFLPYFISNFMDKVNTGVVLNSENYKNMSTTFINVVRNLGNWSFFGLHNGVPNVSFASNYNTNIILLFTVFSIPVISLSALLFKNISGKDKKIIIFLSILLVVLFPLIGGKNESWATSTYISYLFEKIPFLLIFRGTYKWMSLVGLIYSLLLGFVCLEFLKNSSIIKKFITFCFIGGIIIINSFPFFLGNLFLQSNKISNLPNYWKYAQTNLFQDNNPRILILPNQYFNVFKWNDKIQGSRLSFADYLLETKNIYNTCAGCSQYYSNNMVKVIFENLNSKKMDKLLELLGVSYVLQRNDFYYSYYESESPDEIKNILKTWNNIDKVNSSGELDLYKIKEDLVYSRIYSPQEIVSIKSYNEFIDNLDLVDNRKNYYAFLLRDQIKQDDKFRLANKLTEPTKAVQLEYEQINPTKYVVNVNGASESFPLIFSESFHPGWKIYVQPVLVSEGSGQFISEENQGTTQNQNINGGKFYDLLFRKPVLDKNHFLINGYANSWWIDIAELEKQGKVRKNEDGKYDFSVNIEFEPQKYFYLGGIISITTLIACLSYLIWDGVKRRKVHPVKYLAKTRSAEGGISLGK